MLCSPPAASTEEDLPGFVRRWRSPITNVSVSVWPHLLVFCLLAATFQPAESCLPSWFREERSSDSAALSREQQNRIDTPPVARVRVLSESEEGDTVFEVGIITENAKTTDEEYEYEEEEDGEGIKYNEITTTTMAPAVKKLIERLKETECRGYCYHNATCHIEVIFEDEKVAKVVPSCHCPHGWEGRQCDQQFVQAFYAPVSGRYSAASSTVPALAFLIVMLAMFVTLVVYAYKRMSQRFDDSTYMSHAYPPDAFGVLKQTPQRAHSVDSRQQSQVRHKKSATPPNFFAVCRPHVNILREMEVADRFRRLPRVNVSDIRMTSDHIDVSVLHKQVYPISHPSPSSAPREHIVIEMEDCGPQISNSRNCGEPQSPTTSMPMLHDDL